MMKKGIDYEPISGDFGHSNAKAKTSHSQILYPTLVYEGPLVDEVNGVFDSSQSRKSIDNIALETPWGLRYVGNMAKRGQRFPWSISGREKYDHPDFLPTLLLAALSEVSLTGKQIVLITAVPGEWYQDRGLRKRIAAKLAGAYTVKRQGKRKETTAIVAEVRVLSETAGLLYSYILDDRGEIAVQDYRDLTVAAIDIGNHTICIDIFRAMARQGVTLSYTDISMGQIHDSIARQIARETGRHLESYQVQDIIIGEPVVAPQVIKDRVVDLFGQEVAREKNTFLSIVSRSIKDAGNIDVFLVGGGGASQFGDTLTASYSKEKVKIFGQHATAEGLYNYGVRLCSQNK